MQEGSVIEEERERRMLSRRGIQNYIILAIDLILKVCATLFKAAQWRLVEASP